MKVSVAKIKSVTESLPIGLYAKRRIPIAVDEEAHTSSYNPISDEIIISSRVIQEGLKHIHKKRWLETAVRSMVYHEVSHAILTPSTIVMNDCINIFEDERVETILKDYFLDVNFKQNVLYTNGFRSVDEIPDPTTNPIPMMKFYAVVRFGLGKKEWQDKIDALIKKYSKMNSSADRWRAYSYVDDIYNLYREITGVEPPKEDEEFCSSPVPYDTGEGESEDGDDEGESSPSNSGEKADAEDGDEGEESEGDSKEDGAESDDTADDGGDESGSPTHGRDNPLNKKELDTLIKNTFVNNKYVDTKLTEELSMILENFSKKNNSGSALAGYSGTFNTRAIVREDYKYFERKASVNGSNKYGTFHLNLFIDESGSFWRSEDKMNTLLRSLTDIEQKNPNFTMDVVFCGISERVVKNKRQRVFKAEGGNRLDKKTYEIYRKLQRPNTYNYNIACFDGDACSDGGRGDHGFGAFDHNNCVIISDRDNARYISADVHTARVVYTNNYTAELVKNVTDALAKAFR